jgi:hypothetical protein
MLSHKVTINDGLNGGQVIANTTPVTGNFTEIRVISAAVFTTLTGNLDGVGSTSFPANHILRGRFSAITLASGSVVAYHAN